MEQSALISGMPMHNASVEVHVDEGNNFRQAMKRKQEKKELK